MNFIGNAFSLNMLESQPCGDSINVEITKMDAEVAIDVLINSVQEYKSVMGHKDIAGIVSADLDYEIDFNRETIKLRSGDCMLVCQYCGPRLKAGETALPEGAQIDYFFVEIG